MRIFFRFIILILTIQAVPATQIVETDHVKPFRIRVDKERIFISEGAQISVYSKETFKLLSRFGKAGEGPGEFKLLPEFGPELDVSSGRILATSLGKITLISYDGKFLAEKNTSKLGRVELFRPLGDRYAGNAFQFEDKKIWNVINIYDKELKTSKTINKIPFHMKRGEKFNPITRGIYLPNFYISGGKIWVGGALYKDNIRLHDENGRILLDIDPAIERVKFTEKDKQGYIDSYMINADYKLHYERLKQRFLYPDYFPLWQNFIPVDGKIYIQTFARDEQNGTNEFYIYDFGGNYLRTVRLPLTEYFDFTPDPYYIYDNRLYQLSNNYDDEVIELRITEIDQRDR